MSLLFLMSVIAKAMANVMFPSFVELTSMTHDSVTVVA